MGDNIMNSVLKPKSVSLPQGQVLKVNVIWNLHSSGCRGFYHSMTSGRPNLEDIKYKAPRKSWTGLSPQLVIGMAWIRRTCSAAASGLAFPTFLSKPYISCAARQPSSCCCPLRLASASSYPNKPMITSDLGGLLPIRVWSNGGGHWLQVETF